MTLNDHILSTPFDALVPELIKIDAPVRENLYAFKEAYDILRRMKPAGAQEESILVIILDPNEEDPNAPLEQRIHAQHCGGDFWENNLAKEVVIEESVPTLLALAEILWEMTYFGFDPYPREEIPLNRYEKKAEELDHRQFDNYVRAKRGVLQGHLTDYALTPKEWEVYEHRFEHKNRAKRMRDARQERAIKRYKRLGIIEKAIGRILACKALQRRGDSVAPQGSRQAQPARPSLDGELLPFSCRYAPLTVEEPAPSRDGTPAWPRISCRSQIVAPLSPLLLFAPLH